MATVRRRVASFDVDQLVSARAITEGLGYRNVQIVHFWWRNDDSFPEPVFALEGPRGARLWYWPEVEAWARATAAWTRPAYRDLGDEAATRKGGKTPSRHARAGKHWTLHEMAAARYGVAVEDLRGQPAP